MAIERDRRTLDDGIGGPPRVVDTSNSSRLMTIILLAALVIGAYMLFMPRQATISIQGEDRPVMEQRTVPAPVVPSTVPSVPIPKQTQP